ncbi:DUF6227 family protein [Streptomyces gobiensis]|uniref:DUF6227 family protein n=1 Tax=Streptomyces gobiensis TaxID=2875706 RepID=UPI001E416F4F|nr:DUF6227 family protein [Streptomyces gobiensis]UGY94561.1 DUF6227 family protein [Streptomyces gobiensis]
MSSWPRHAGNTAPGEHLEQLLACARNPFEISDTLATRLATAVSCDVQLRSWRQHNTPPPPTRCRTYRHTFMLSDSTGLVLWELQHDTEADGQLVHEIYADVATLRAAERHVHTRMGDAPDDPFGSVIASNVVKLSADLLTEMEVEIPGQRSFSEQDSPDHARRLLRRARNPDRPGDEMLRLLSTARRHHITRVARPLSNSEHRSFCSVYEHAFLLDDGREVSLFELEHDFTPDGQLVCEVYPYEAAADRAAERHALAHGPGRHRSQ